MPELGREVPRGAKYAQAFHRAQMIVLARWSMLTQSGVVEGSSCRLSAGVGPRDDRPRVRVGGRFAGEVARIELGDGGVEVVEVEHDDRHDLVVVR